MGNVPLRVTNPTNWSGVLSPGISLHFSNGLGCGGTLAFFKTENLTGYPHQTQMIFIGCDSGECAFKSDQPYKLVRSYLQVSHYTSQMAWDVVELWLSLKQKT